MPEQTGTPDNGQGAETPGNGQGFDYERAYGELRPEFTRATQELSQYRDRLSGYEALFQGLHSPDPDEQREAMEALGLEVAEAGSPGPQGGSSAEDEFVDPLEEQLNAANERIAALESAREQEAAEREESQLTAKRDEYIGAAIGLIEDALTPEGAKESFKFTQREEEVLGNLAIGMPDEEGLPDVRAAYQALYGPQDSVLEVNRARWITTKTSAQPAPLGTTIPADKKPRTAADRIAYADQRWADIQNQQ